MRFSYAVCNRGRYRAGDKLIRSIEYVGLMHRDISQATALIKAKIGVPVVQAG